MRHPHLIEPRLALTLLAIGFVPTEVTAQPTITLTKAEGFVKQIKVEGTFDGFNVGECGNIKLQVSIDGGKTFVDHKTKITEAEQKGKT